MNNEMTNVLREKLKDHRKHKVKTTGLPKLFVDDMVKEVYRVRKQRYFPLGAAGIGFVIGLLVGHFLTRLF